MTPITNQIRQDFPILSQTVHGKPLVYLDNAASAQKPARVIETIKQFYEKDYSNVHRAVYSLGERATEAYENAREKIRNFINAKESREIIFVRGTTEAINLVANSYGRHFLMPGDEIIISEMEHHSNIVPWQMICAEKKAILRVIPFNDAGELILEEYKKLLTDKTKLVAITHMSNSLGTINPVKEMIELAHKKNIPVFLDGAQAIAHLKIDVQALDCDFYAFSGHKLFGPTGIGILYGKEKWLEAMPPYQGGGDMIARVTFAKTDYRELPFKFEAGTPHVAGVIGLGAAIDYLNTLDFSAVTIHEEKLRLFAEEALQKIPQLKLIGTAKEKGAIISFVLDHVHAHDIGTILDSEGIAVRAGHHCTMPVMEHYDIPASVRVSFAFYNTKEEVEALVRGLKKVSEIFHV